MLYGRHAIGSKLLFETEQYTVEERENTWVITAIVDKRSAKQVIAHKHEANFFIAQTNEKIWFYSSNDHINYNENENKLIIFADNRIKYPV